MPITTEAKTTRGSVAKRVYIRDPDKPKLVAIRPEIYRQLRLEIVDTGESLKDCVHKHLVHSLGHDARA
jgi:hypothetical protein